MPPSTASIAAPRGAAMLMPSLRVPSDLEPYAARMWPRTGQRNALPSGADGVVTPLDSGVARAAWGGAAEVGAGEVSDVAAGGIGGAAEADGACGPGTEDGSGL